MSSNLIVSLFNWCHRQDENFTSEAFIHLLNILAENDPKSVAEIIKLLTNNIVFPTIDEVGDFFITSQYHTEKGTPDIVIKSNKYLIFIEVKDWSDLGKDQIYRYKSAILSPINTQKIKIVTLLTRQSIIGFDDDNEPHASCRWYLIARKLEELYEKNNDIIVKHEINQFLEYLRSRGMNPGKVTWEFENGIKSARYLIQMIEESIKALNISYKRSGGFDWIGFYIENDKVAWTGFTYDDPHILIFQSCGNITECQAPPFGYIKDASSCEGGKRWQYEIKLNDENEYFYAKSKTNQLKRIEEFIKKGMEGLKQFNPPFLQK